MQITRICKSLIIIILKNMIIFLEKTRTWFSTKVVHLFRKTRTRFYRVIRQKTRTNIEIDNNPPYHDENFPHQSRVSLRLYQNPSPNSKANRKLSVEPNQEYLVVNLFKKVSQIPPP